MRPVTYPGSSRRLYTKRFCFAGCSQGTIFGKQVRTWVGPPDIFIPFGFNIGRRHLTIYAPVNGGNLRGHLSKKAESTLRNLNW